MAPGMRSGPVRRVALSVTSLLLALSTVGGCSGSDAGRLTVLHTDATYAYGHVSPQQIIESVVPAHPIDPGRSPWVLMIHGGGWIEGTADQMAASAGLASRHGYVVFSIGYRLLTATTTFAQQWSDVVHAWRWVRAHAASLGLDPARGAVWGASAGGHLAAMLGNREPGVRAVVSIAGVLQPSLVAQVVAGTGQQRVDLDSQQLLASGRNYSWLYSVLAERVVRTVWRADDAASVARWHAADPGHYLRRGSPPTLVVQGSADDVVPPVTAQAYAAQLTAYRVPHETVMVARISHSESQLVDGAGGRMVAFLRKYLR